MAPFLSDIGIFSFQYRFSFRKRKRVPLAIFFDLRRFEPVGVLDALQGGLSTHAQTAFVDGVDGVAF